MNSSIHTLDNQSRHTLRVRVQVQDKDETIVVTSFYSNRRWCDEQPARQQGKQQTTHVSCFEIDSSFLPLNSC